MNDFGIKITDTIKSVLNSEKEFLHEPRFNDDEIINLKKCIESTFVSTVGQYVNQFENEIASYTKSKRAIAVVNGTSALHIALKLSGVGEGEEVICPALSFVATANAISYLNAIPHFVDCNEKTLGIDPLSLRNWLESSCEKISGNLINKNTGRKISAIVPMHTFGHPSEIMQILDIAKDFEIPMIEDAAESLGSFYKNQHTGTFGDLGVLSFNGNKIITTGGGGVILTNDIDLANKAKHITNTAKKPHQWRYIHDEVGYNYRMPNLNASLGCAQLRKLNDFCKSKRNLFLKYEEAFRNFNGITLFQEPPLCRSNYWLQTLILDRGLENELEKILEYTNNNGIMTRPSWDLLSNLRMFKECPKAPLPIANSLSKRIINIPSSAYLI
tara:strand:- start:30 stop:1187 length:1158 start_codon:yes stop_codon:yes gene_type:complete